MHFRNKLKFISLFQMFFVILFLCACTDSESNSAENTSDLQPTSESGFVQLDQTEETLQKIVGWLSNEEVLVHIGNQQSQQLVQLNIKTGERTELYSTTKYILTVKINSELDKIMFQEGVEQSVELVIISKTGDELNRKEIDYAGYVTADWNHVEDHLLFLSYYQYDTTTGTEHAKVMVWNLEDNTISELPIQSIEPSWYSSHLYLYMDETTSQLHLGDTRSAEEAQVLSNEVLGFYLHQDTVISVVASDINEQEVHLIKEYPFLVQQGVITIPKVSMGDRIMKPFLSQSNRNGMIVGSIPDASIDLTQDLGTFSLSILNFDQSKMKPIISLPENAPLAISPNEKYVLYGWQFENVITLEENASIHSLISNPI